MKMSNLPTFFSSLSSDVDECISSPCQNGANCIQLFNRYRCDCNVGWQGTNCDLGEYINTQLQHSTSNS